MHQERHECLQIRLHLQSRRSWLHCDRVDDRAARILRPVQAYLNRERILPRLELVHRPGHDFLLLLVLDQHDADLLRVGKPQLRENEQSHQTLH